MLWSCDKAAVSTFKAFCRPKRAYFKPVRVIGAIPHSLARLLDSFYRGNGFQNRLFQNFLSF